MRVWILVAAAAVGSSATAAVYEVGPGQALANVGDVPWESLGPGDEVNIHWRATPYAEKFVIGVSGAAGNPIVVRGLRGPGGERPVIDGRDATTRSQLNFWNEVRGLIKIGGANSPPDTTPSYIVVEGLELRSVRPPFQFTGRNGLDSYANNAAAIYIEKGADITIRDCVLHDSGNGLFIGSGTTDVMIEGNHFYDNGIENSIFEHNSYTEALRITFQFNHYGPLRTDALGNNLKDRSAGLVVRYNWIESGNRQLDLVDAGGGAQLWLEPEYATTYVYGNVLVEHEGDGNRQMVHYGGDSGDDSRYRKGRLYFHHNTLVSTRTGRNTLLRLSTNAETADVRNNIIYTTSAGSELELLSSTGVLDFSHNWLRPGWNASFAGGGTLNDDGTSIEGTDPGFVDRLGSDYGLAVGSPAIDVAASLDVTLVPDHLPTMHYLRLLGREPRPDDGAPDLGAYEFCAAACAPTDGGTADSGRADSGTTDSGGTPDSGSPDSGGADGGSADGSIADGGGADDAPGCGCTGSGAAVPLCWLLVVVALRRRCPS